ncbi:MAG: hypothetical protein N3G20_03595 [Verrucomicrobiae bacterium]|nr:hypothetical protein [Verrucomicrobiae bacterium]
MKKIIAVGAVVAATSAFADTQGSITIQGTVQEKTSISVQPVSGYNNLNLEQGATDLVVATVTEVCNYPRGYTVTLKSQNAESRQAYLQGYSLENTDRIPYSIKYGNSVVNLDDQGEAKVTDANGKTPKNGVTRQVKITFSGGDWLAADTYSDTLTFTIAAKL